MLKAEFQSFGVLDKCSLLDLVHLGTGCILDLVDEGLPFGVVDGEDCHDGDGEDGEGGDAPAQQDAPPGIGVVSIRGSLARVNKLPFGGVGKIKLFGKI